MRSPEASSATGHSEQHASPTPISFPSTPLAPLYPFDRTLRPYLISSCYMSFDDVPRRAPSTPPPDDFAQIHDDAKNRCGIKTGHDLEDASLSAKLRGVSVEDIIQIFDNCEEHFGAFRVCGKKSRKAIEPVVCVHQFFLETGGKIAASVSYLPQPFTPSVWRKF